MKTELDTIREALEASYYFLTPRVPKKMSEMRMQSRLITRALAALSTIDPDAQRNVKELRDLFDLQHTSTMEADKLWQKANGKDCLPDLGELIEWLMKRSDPDAIRREGLDELLCAAKATLKATDRVAFAWKVGKCGPLSPNSCYIPDIATALDRLRAAILATEPAREAS